MLETAWTAGILLASATTAAVWLLVAGQISAVGSVRLNRYFAGAFVATAAASTGVSALLSAKSVNDREVTQIVTPLASLTAQAGTAVAIGILATLFLRKALSAEALVFEPHLLAALAFAGVLLASDLANGDLSLDPQRFAFLALILVVAMASPRLHSASLAGALPLVVLTSASLLLTVSGADWAVTRPRRIPIPTIDFRMTGLLFQHNQMGLIAASALVSSVALPRKYRRIVVPIMAVALVLTDSRSSIYSGFVALLVALVYRRGFSPNRLVVSAGVAVTTVLALFTAIGAQERDGLGDRQLTGRTELWRVAMEIFGESPLIGSGFETFGAVFREARGFNWAGQAHNQWIQSLSQAGIVGALAFAAYVWLLGRAAARHASVTAGVAPALFILFLLQGISESVLWIVGFGPALLAHAPLLLIVTAAERTQKTDADETPSDDRPLESRTI